MFPHLIPRTLLAAGLVIGLVVGTKVAAGGPDLRLFDTVDRIVQTMGARVGILVRDTGSDWSISHRADERFLMTSTFKPLLCGAVLDRVDAGDLDLDEPVEIEATDILDYAPVTKTLVGGTMSLGELCFAALDMSDNTATNLLIDYIGGPQAVTEFLRAIGDTVSRLDRREPDLNTFSPGDPRDTTTPAAMVSTLEAMLLGDDLSLKSRSQLVDWMSRGSVTGALIRASKPDGWGVADRSGSGSFNRNIVAMVTPPDQSPFLVAVFLSDADADSETRNAAVIEFSKAVMDFITSR